jgi:hypothetical protein
MVNIHVSLIYRMESPSYWCKWVIDACISSSTRPFVSGTSFATDKTAEPHMPMYMKNVPESGIAQKFFLSIIKKMRILGYKDYV